MNRINSLTTKAVLYYKITLLGIIGGLLVIAMLSSFLRASDDGFLRNFENYLYIVLYAYYGYIAFNRLKKIRYVVYDQENLYVDYNGYKVQIPFEEIKEVNLVSLDGLYKFLLYEKNQFGIEVLCKPSMWYPFNYKKVDAELNRIRKLIEVKKEKNRIELSNGNTELGLPSQTA